MCGQERQSPLAAAQFEGLTELEDGAHDTAVDAQGSPVGG